MSIQTEYKLRCKTPSDINENLNVLMRLAKECNHVTEMGVRYIVSTYAFLEGLKGRNGTLVSIDITHPSDYGGDLGLVEKLAKEEGINFQFVLGDTRLIDIDETDLLFIDTEHTYVVLQNELNRHSDKVRKYIAFHDVVSCKDAIMPAINELIAQGKWKIKEHHTNNNGILVLERA